MSNTLHSLLGMDCDEAEKERGTICITPFQDITRISGVSICERLKRHQLYEFSRVDDNIPRCFRSYQTTTATMKTKMEPPRIRYFCFTLHTFIAFLSLWLFFSLLKALYVLLACFKTVLPLFSKC